MGSTVMSKITQLSKPCAGNGCPNDGVNQLTVIYLNRVGWFCNICKTELIKEGLVFDNIEGTEPLTAQPQIPSTESIPNRRTGRQSNIGNQEAFQHSI
jgi:hypothetical protein